MTILEGIMPIVTPVKGYPPVTVLICTRNRGDAISMTIKSLLLNNYPSFNILIIDQSTNDETAKALETFKNEHRIYYLRSDSKGLGLARNIGLKLITNEIVVMTDDDCEVPPSWIRQMVKGFEISPNIGLVFCDVVAAPYDSTAGFIPVSISQKPLLIENLAQWKGDNIGIGAGMAVRLTASRQIGWFDESLGPGGRFRNADDFDFAFRMLAGKYHIYRTNATSVLHYGFRTHKEGRQLMRDSMFSIGAVHGKLLKCGYWQVFPYYLLALWSMVIVPAVTSMAQLHKPLVLGRAIELLRGFFIGLCTAVDRQKVMFIPQHMSR